MSRCTACERWTHDMEWLATAFFGEGHGCCDELARVEKSGRVRLKEMWRDAISDGDNADNVARRNRPLAVPSPLSCFRLPLSCAPPEPIFAYPRYLDGGKSKGGLHADWPAAPPLSLTPHASHPPSPPLSAFRATLSSFGLLIIYRIII